SYYSSSTNMPVSSGAFQSNNAGGNDMFLIKLDKDGNKIWATYYGGSGAELGGSLCLDKSGNIYSTGGTASTNFPVTSGAYQSSTAGGFDGFLLKFNTAGSRQWATCIGGGSDDKFYGLSMDTFLNVYLSGHSASTNYPVTSGAYQTSKSGGQDA